MSSKSTIYVDVSKPVKNDLAELKKDIEFVKSKVERSKKIMITKRANQILSEGTKYNSEINEATELYNKTISAFKQVYKEGLYSPTIDNKKLELAYELRNKFLEYFYRNRIISKVIELNSWVKDSINDLKTNS